MTHVLAVLFHYRDGSVAGRELMRGPYDVCVRTRDLLPAVSVSDPEIIDAVATLPTVSEWESILATGTFPEVTP